MIVVKKIYYEFYLNYIGGTNIPPRVITITNQKGGTGKTTLTALLGYGLLEKGFRVLLVDLDPQAHLSSFFIKINELENISDGVFEAVGGQTFRIRKIVQEKLFGLIPSGLNYIVKVYRGQIPAWDPYALYKRISTEPAINIMYDYVICDTPPELFPPTMWGLYAADYIIIPSNLEELSISGTKLLLREVIPEVVMYSKRQPNVLGVTLINITKKVSKETINKLNNAIKGFIRERLPSSIKHYIYEEPFFNTVIHRYDDLKDLLYRPRRHELPLSRVLQKNEELKKEVEEFTNELISRINNFRSLT